MAWDLFSGDYVRNILRLCRKPFTLLRPKEKRKGKKGAPKRTKKG